MHGHVTETVDPGCHGRPGDLRPPPQSRLAAAPAAEGDARPLRLAAAGDEAAFAALYARHHQDLYRYCRTLVRRDHDAQDVLQTTMLRALAALRRGAPDAPPRPWLFRIAHNEAVSLLRRRRPEDGLDAVAATGGRPLEAEVGERDRLRQLVADLSDLPERRRGALVMRELSGLFHAEIAQALGVGVTGAKQAIAALLAAPAAARAAKPDSASPKGQGKAKAFSRCVVAAAQLQQDKEEQDSDAATS